MKQQHEAQGAPSAPDEDQAGAPRPDLARELAALRLRVALLEDTTRVSRARLAVLGAMTHGLGAVLDVQEACTIALDLLQGLLPSLQSLAIYLADRPAMVLQRRAAVGPPAWSDEGATAISLHQDTLFGRALWYNRTQIGYGAACASSGPAAPEQGAVCCALVPMRAGATVVGVLRVAAEGQSITVDEVAFLEVVAAQIAVEVYTLERRAFVQSIVDQSPAGQVVVEVPHGHVVLANQVAHELWGRHLAPVVQDGLTCSLVTAADLGLAPLAHTLATGQGVAGEEGAITRPDGSVVPVLVSTTALHTRPGEAQYVACTVHDLSGVKRVDALKDEFLSIVSHELRTPLTAAKGFVQLGLRRLQGQDAAQTRRTFTEAEAAIADLTALVEELLEFSRLQAGRFQINPEPLELRDLVERRVRHLRGLSERHRIEVRAPSAPVLVEGDYRRLEQVVTNLVGNAIKYSPRGGEIVVTLAQGDGEVLLSVRDPGIGIPPEERERIFTPYYRARNTYQRHFGGLGMGLYISRSIVEHHGGRIWVEQMEGEGTTMVVSLPLLPAMPV